MGKILLTTFTDPMMGLSYECEPIFRKLETHFGDRIEFKYVMAGLVRDVSDFMLPQELSLPAEDGIRTYNSRLGKIYEDEEAITGMPICMDGFHLFDTDHRSSYPLNIAYTAAQIASQDKADLFLYNLRYATIVETRQTTLTEELAAIAEDTGIDKGRFLNAFSDGIAKAVFQKDLKYSRSLGIRSLPAYLFQYGEKAILINRLIGYDMFVSAISKISGGTMLPSAISDKNKTLPLLLKEHPLISCAELLEALDIESREDLSALVQPILSADKSELIPVKDTWFLKTVNPS